MAIDLLSTVPGYQLLFNSEITTSLPDNSKHGTFDGRLWDEIGE